MIRTTKLSDFASLSKLVLRLTFVSFLLLLTNFAFAQKAYIQDEIRAKGELLKAALEPNVKTANQDSYDARYYQFQLEVDPAVQNAAGTVTAIMEITAGPLNTIDLHLAAPMTVNSALVNGSGTTFTRNGEILTIDLDRFYENGEKPVLTVNYSGAPVSTGLGSFTFSNYSGKPLVTTLSFPYGARDWWPCKDVSSDKPDSMDIIYTVPEGMVAASNGILISEESAAGKTTFHWKVNYPISTYLVCLTAYEYTRYTDWYVSAKGDSLPIEFFVAPEHFENSQPNFFLTKNMISIYSYLFGEYPFMEDKYGHAEFQWGGGMEHQTMTSLGPISSSQGIYDPLLIAHELSHMWWGDMITCANFHEIWLNEGFATYSVALYREVSEGETGYWNEVNQLAYNGPGTIYVQDTTDIWAILDGNLSYNKAAYVLHMLRHVVGDSTFFNILRTYYDDGEVKYKNASTADFQRVCESVSGLDLSKFFQQWIYGEYYPYYAYGHTVDTLAKGYQINLFLDQVQDNAGLFTMPVDVRITTGSGEQNFVVWDSLASQQFEFTVDSEPISVEIDPDNWILKKTRELLIDPPLDSGALLINGLNWTLGNDVRSAYEDKSFWGNVEIQFWDLFDEPAAGYPGSLPTPIGNGTITGSVIENYSTLIWVSHNNGGDLEIWQSLPITDYLNAGGNIILMTRNGQNFVSNSLADYLGITWDAQPSLIITECKSEYSGLTDMELIRSNTLVSLFDTDISHAYSHLIFSETASFDPPKGIGVWTDPNDGGQFVYMAVRPYLIEHEALKNNMQYILSDLMGEPVGVEDGIGAAMPTEFQLFQNYPNPFNPSTTIKYSIADESKVTLKIYNLLGEEIAEILNALKSAGEYEIEFDAGNLSSGVYLYELSAVTASGAKIFNDTKKFVLLK